MKKFRTWYDTKIEEVEVDRETEKFVILTPDSYNSPRRDAKRSTYTNYHDTWQEAHAFLIAREEDAIRGHQNDIKRHQETLQKIMEMHQ